MALASMPGRHAHAHHNRLVLLRKGDYRGIALMLMCMGHQALENTIFGLVTAMALICCLTEGVG